MECKCLKNWIPDSAGMMTNELLLVVTSPSSIDYFIDRSYGGMNFSGRKVVGKLIARHEFGGRNRYAASTTYI
jgi:hypothetical protein